MTSSFPVLLARTRAGYDLPIIDVTHPRFGVADDAASRTARSQAFLSDHRQRRWIPGFLLRFMLRQLARKSRLASAMFDRQSPYLDGISTYVMKLGADNLVAPFDSEADRRFAASSHITLLRLRTQQTATLMAQGIAEDPALAGAAPLHLVNIAGGPALARFVAGSVTSGGDIRKRMIAMSGFQVIPRGLEGFRPLAEAAHFTIAKTEPALLSDQVLLRPIPFDSSGKGGH